MRQGNSNNKQQQQRMRGRGGNNSGGGGNTNRKGPNPLNRSYESTGPDVKIRGTALHIAEKYVQLARDAQSSGDRVLAESYLQHAEHYYRIIAAAQAQLQQPITVVRSDIQVDEDDDDDLDTAVDVRANAPFVNADAPQPFIEDAAAAAEGTEPAPRSNGERSMHDRQPPGERPQRDRFGRDRGDRFGGDRGERNGDRGERTDGERNGDRGGRMNNNGQRGYRGGNDYRSNGARNGYGDAGQMGAPTEGGRGEGNRFEPGQNDTVRADASRLENRTEGRPEYRSERGDRFGNRGERPMRERPQYRSERGDRPERGSRYEGERREARTESFEPTSERAAEPVVSNELPAFITGIQPRSEARAERAPRVERFEEPAPAPVAAPAPAPVVAEPAPAPAPPVAAAPAPVAEAAAEAPAAPVKRPRGRPRKVPLEAAPVVVADE